MYITKYISCARFIDDLVCLNDGGEFNDFYREIYPNELEQKCEHHEREKHATFLDLDIIKISGDKFIAFVRKHNIPVGLKKKTKKCEP